MPYNIAMQGLTEELAELVPVMKELITEMKEASRQTRLLNKNLEEQLRRT
jgi:hypothetical protein